MPGARHAMTNGHCSLQLRVWGGGRFEPPVVPRQSADGGPKGKTPGRFLDPTVYICQKNAKNKPS